MKTWQIIAAIVVFGAVLAGTIWWQVYQFHDCRRVGHSLLYCIGKLGL